MKRRNLLYILMCIMLFSLLSGININTGDLGPNGVQPMAYFNVWFWISGALYLLGLIISLWGLNQTEKTGKFEITICLLWPISVFIFLFLTTMGWGKEDHDIKYSRREEE